MSVTLAGGGNGGDGIRGDIYIHLQAENAVAYYIATRPIFDLWLEVTRRPRERMKRSCKEKGGLVITGIWGEGGVGKAGGDRGVGQKEQTDEAVRIM